MSAADDDAATLKALQDAIYRDQVLRARGMTVEERLEEVFELANSAFGRMHAGAMWQLETQDPDVAWAEVRRRMDRLCKTRDHGLYVTDKPLADES